MLVSDILKDKGGKVTMIAGAQTVREALKTMVENKIGAVLVMDASGEVSGVFSERDLMRVCHQNESAWGSALVETVMTPRVIMCKAGDTLEYVMNLMTQQRIRHVPVVDESKICGIVTIGDLVKAQLKVSQVQVQYLKDFLHGA